VNAAIAKAAYHEVIQLELGLIHDLKLQKQLLENQADSGMTSYAGILSVSESLENSRATLAQSEQKKDQIDHFISSLLGEDTSQASLPNATLRTMILPSDLPLSLPSELVRQRPDILIAEAQMHSNSAAVGVATAMLWPSISLTAGGGFTRPQLNALNGPSQRFWSIGPSINFPLFTGGTLSYQKEAAIQQLVSSEAQYRQTVLNAFANVSDALTALQHDASYLAALDQVKADAELTFTLAELNNAAGLTDYGAVLNARILYQQAQINYWQAYAQRLQDTVSLFVSLGGGWWNPPDLHS
jgi:NodT family efflux transporter outer membrane factor (OMF) lipoprotein